jgi:hypothetical protein
MHYRRLSNTGDTGEAESRTNHDLDRTCQAEGCDKPWTSKKYCDKHYRRFKANGDPLVTKVGGKPKAFCTAKDCDRPAFGQGLCNMHYKRARKNKVLPTPKSISGQQSTEVDDKDVTA